MDGAGVRREVAEAMIPHATLCNSTANAEGVLARAYSYFPQLHLLNPDQIAAASFFHDRLQHVGPATVEAGERRFYQLTLPIGVVEGVVEVFDRVDGHWRFSTIPLPPYRHAQPSRHPADLRVLEVPGAEPILYLLFASKVNDVDRAFVRRVVAGEEQWAVQTGLSTHVAEGYHGGWDVDEHGILHVLPADGHSVTVRRYDQTGREIEPLILRDPAGGLESGPPHEMRVRGGTVYVQPYRDTEFFRAYDARTGAHLRTVATGHDELTADFPDDTGEFGPWTAGGTVRIKPALTRHENGTSRPLTQPHWRAWARTLGGLDYRRLTLTPHPDGGFDLAVPTDLTGVAQVKISAEVSGWQRGLAPEHVIQRWVEVRTPGTTGSISVVTRSAWSSGPVRGLSTDIRAANRTSYGRGEPIEAEVILRGPAPDRGEVDLELVDATGAVVHGRKVYLSVADERATVTLPAALTTLLRPGEYRLRGRAPGRTLADQPLTIGPGLSPMPFPFLQFGDYNTLYPSRPWTSGGTSPNEWDTPDVVAAQVQRTRRLGVRLFAERLGDGNKRHLTQDYELAIAQKQLWDWLSANGIVAPERAVQAPPAIQALTGYGAFDARVMAILVGNDAALPYTDLRDGHDSRTRQEVLQDLDEATAALTPHPAFRGWIWAANWFPWRYLNGRSVRDAETQAAEDPGYAALLRETRQTGRWHPEHDARSDLRMRIAAEQWRVFADRLRPAHPQLVLASAGSVQNGAVYPPLTFAGLDEVDRHLQAEQFPIEGWAGLVQDFARRPGKRGLFHPELWNDPGTGETILNTHAVALTRGADSAGVSMRIPATVNPIERAYEDGRSGYPGIPSIYRALGGLVADHGPWLAELTGADRVAILLSSRAFRLQSWPAVHYQPAHLRRVHEAYETCLLAGFPATLVYVEDLAHRPLTEFTAVLLVDEPFELEPAVVTALNALPDSIAVRYDGTCNAAVITEDVPRAKPLGVSFDRIDRFDDGAGADRIEGFCEAPVAMRRQAILAGVPELRAALAAVAQPVAEVSVNGVPEPQVLVSERRAEDGRYLFVANDTHLGLPQGLLRRTGGAASNRAPLAVQVGLQGRTGAVYDVFAGRRVDPVDGAVTASLQHLALRVFAVLPTEIASVRLTTESRTATGHLPWRAEVLGADGLPIKAAVPLRLTLHDATGAELDRRTVTAGSAGVSGSFPVPLNAAPGPVTLTATELFSGMQAQHSTRTPVAVPPFRPLETRFGAKFREIALAADGRTALLTGMDLGRNTHHLDLDTGNLRWQRKIGQHYAFGPARAGDSFAAIGTSFDRPQGYGLYLLTADGRPVRRFDLHGLTTRQGNWGNPAVLSDRPVHFAVPADGAWVATSGNLGLAVWAADGTLLWRADRAHDHRFDRQPATLAVLGEDTLLVIDGTTMTAHSARNRTPLWTQDLRKLGSWEGSSGEARSVVVSADRSTFAVLTSARGGLVHVIRSANPATAVVLPVDTRQAALAPDGSALAAIVGNQLRYHDLAQPDTARWSYGGDDLLHNPRLAPDGRVAVTSELGTLTVLSSTGEILLERDFDSLPVPAWLPGGDLLVATWMGHVHRLTGPACTERWHTHITNQDQDIRATLTAPDPIPVSRINGWGNAEPNPAPLTPNLAKDDTTKDQVHARTDKVALPLRRVTDGDPTPRQPPLPDWHHFEVFGERYGQPDAFLHVPLTGAATVTGITLVEDPARPHAWLRHLRLDYLATNGNWTTIGPLLSDAATRTHKLATPVRTTEIRLRLPDRPVDRLAIAEIVVHGQPGPVPDHNTFRGTLENSPPRTTGVGPAMSVTSRRL